MLSFSIYILQLKSNVNNLIITTLMQSSKHKIYISALIYKIRLFYQ